MDSYTRRLQEATIAGAGAAEVAAAFSSGLIDFEGAKRIVRMNHGRQVNVIQSIVGGADGMAEVANIEHKAESFDRIAALSRRIKESQAAFRAAREKANAEKRACDKLQADLQALIQGCEEPLPLFQSPASSSSVSQEAARSAAT